MQHITEQKQRTVASAGPCKIYIFHKKRLRKTTDGFKGFSTAKEALIPIGQSKKKRSPIGPSRDGPQGSIGGIKSQPKTTQRKLRVKKNFSNLVSRRKAGMTIIVKKPQDIPLRVSSPQIELSTSRAGRVARIPGPHKARPQAREVFESSESMAEVFQNQ